MRGKWTEGPWKVECGDHTHRYVLVTDSDDRTIYYKYGAGTAKAADQDEANARLIAASPTIATELEWIAAFAEMRAEDDSKTFARVNRAALRTIAERARTALSLAHPPKGEE